MIKEYKCMNLLTQRLIDNEKFKQYMLDIKNKVSPVSISGLSDVGKMHILAATLKANQRPIIVVTYNELQAKKLAKDLLFFGYQSEYFPKKEISPYDFESQSKDLPYERIHTLNKIYANETNVVVTTIEALMQELPTKELLYKNILKFEVGKEFKTPNNTELKTRDLEKLKQILIELGYERNDLVENNGQFSVRGGIVDIGLSEKNGIRIEFWGDEVDSIRYFNISSQRSSDNLQEITIYPAHEYIIENDLKEKICENIEKKNENARI